MKMTRLTGVKALACFMVVCTLTNAADYSFSDCGGKYATLVVNNDVNTVSPQPIDVTTQPFQVNMTLNFHEPIPEDELENSTIVISFSYQGMFHTVPLCVKGDAIIPGTDKLCELQLCDTVKHDVCADWTVANGTESYSYSFGPLSAAELGWMRPYVSDGLFDLTANLMNEDQTESLVCVVVDNLSIVWGFGS